MAARSVAPGSLRPVTRSLLGGPRSCRPGLAPPSRPRPVSLDVADPLQEVLVDLDVDVDVAVAVGRRSGPPSAIGSSDSVWASGSSSAPAAAAGPLRRDFDGAGAAPCGISRNRITWYGKKNVDSIWSMKMGRLPSIIRRFVHSSPTSSADGSSNRSTSSGCSFAAWMTTLRIMPRCSRTPVSAVTARWSPARWSSRRPLAGHRVRRSGVVEVDDQPDAAVRRPRRRCRTGRSRGSSGSCSGRRCTASRSGSTGATRARR